MPKSLTITGSRSTQHRELSEYRDLFAAYIGPFAVPDSHFYLGGASGIDSLALLWLSDNTSARLTVVVPATLADQPADARHAVATVRDSGRLDDLVELKGEARTTGYHARNRWMVDRSEFIIGFPLATDLSSGTAYTLDYAATHGKPRLIVPI
ncbi:hypothetical protein Aple_046280 [Acrocarpospora pleiomorpha]|uniref:DNA recombination-mediator protein A n=1 Tax=Acrocarpospora pleiomorpha TaxID=90975 RepID=A0A5M3XLH8_9ACTN|nr:hypothetical protein [Acrocarpospora pleiomorpha]GES21732.1 hypothetical protein Aple_046280 [Acrocarpospora pleiomorpha]